MTSAKTTEAYQEAVRFLYTLRWFGAKLGLENTFKLAELAGNPQERLRFIHVAGTNGKGSTCAILESIYRASGLRVGLFTSPHLVSFRERIQVNRRLIDETDVVRLVDRMRPLLRLFPEQHHPTFFEALTVMALSYFAEQKCDLVIWETGLGGRLDATNIVTPLASVITNVHCDHQQWLGETLAGIAAEKAGIIKAGVPVITAAAEPEALAVIARTAQERNAPLIQVEPVLRLKPTQAAHLPLFGEHQKVNAALALAAVHALHDRFPVSDTAISAGLSGVNWPGRLQLIAQPTGRKLLLDGAHNVSGAEALAAALKAQFPNASPTLVLGILEDKDWRGICRVLAPLAGKIVLVPVPSERTAAPRDLADACVALNSKARISRRELLADALQDSAADELVVITGSLYLVGEAMELLGLAGEARNERALNEWSANRPVEAAKQP